MRRVALLRGVNLGGRKVVMSELRALCESAGFTGVETLLASGNIVLNAKLAGAKLEAKLEKIILEGLGLKTDVFVRDAAELDAVIAANPFRGEAKRQPNFLVVYFLRAPMSAAERAAIAAHDGPEQVRPGKGCLYVWYPNGQGRSKLKLPRLGTARNWNTATKLAAAARGE
jgi:uncharacterized protein (DUF1697 family)